MLCGEAAEMRASPAKLERRLLITVRSQRRLTETQLERISGSRADPVLQRGFAMQRGTCDAFDQQNHFGHGVQAKP
jgi:hypothetical protein